MRPIRLTMQAFGAYREKTELDFGALGDRTFFLIHGPTGSGKTTILDAICYALYGETSGKERTSKTVRSDFADVNLRTYVELVFAVGQDVYRIERSPEQERAKVRGTGTMLEKPQATMWHVTDSGEKVLAGSTSTVTSYVESMLGFECSQFRQVVLLPQGEFRRLLMASSVERQEIMQTLFQTELYEKIEQRLKEKAGTVKKAFDTIGEQRRIILEASGADSEEALAEKIAELRREESAQTALAKEKDEALQKADAALTEGLRIHALFAEKKNAHEAQTAAEEAQKSAQPLREEWTVAARAQKLRASEAYLTQEENTLRTKQVSLDLCKTVCAEACKAADEAERTYKTEQAREADRQAAREARSALEKQTEAVSQLAEAQKKCLEAQKTMDAAQKERDAKAKDCDKFEKALEQLRAERENKLTIAKASAGCAEEKERLTYLLKTRRDYETLLRDIAKEDQTIKEKQQQVLRLDKEAGEAEEAYHKAEMRWQSAQAGILAQSLAEGTPCPVCGSTHHPNLAPLGEAPSEETRKTAKQKAEDARASHAKENLALATLAAHQQARRAKQAELYRALGDCTFDAKALDTALRSATKRADEAKKAVAEAEELKKRIEKGDKILAETKTSRDAADKAYQDANGAYRSAKAIADERRSQIPEALTADGALARAKREADKRIAELETAWQKAEADYRKTSVDAVTAKAQVMQAEKAIEEQSAKCRTLLKDLLREAETLGFADRQAVLTAMRTDAWLTDTETKLKSIDEAVRSAQDRLARAKQATEGLALPALETLESAKNAAKEAHLTAVRDLQSKKDAIAARQEDEKKLADCAKKLAGLQEGYRIIGHLAQVAGGDNEKKLTFQRFVLSELLTEVAEVASQRLLKMSRKRFLLQRTDERARKNAAGGLDLEVFDNYTGIARPVGTLSGGEGFLASLALALGLADVVRSYACGIRLDTMLIDEGFGTLDPEMLDFAIRTLLDLQQGGRLVGIISHVPELKERIDARLEVMQTTKGSTAVFRIG